MSENFYKFDNTEVNPNFPQVKDVDPQEVFQATNGVFLVDVRRPDEYTGELGHVPGSILITLDTLGEHMDKIPKDKTVVFVCRSGGRSASAAAMAMDDGYSEVFNMKGGMIQWNQLELVTEGKS